jgi:AraC-like DNA-binding protein
MRDTAADRLTFRSDDLPECDRLRVFVEEVMPRFVAVDVHTPGEGRFRVVLEAWRANAVNVASVETTPLDWVRTRALVGDGDDALCFILCRSGNARAIVRRHTHDLQVGDGVTFDHAVPTKFLVRAESHFWCLKIQRASVIRFFPDVDVLAGTRLLAQAPTVRLLFQYLSGAHAMLLAESGHATDVFGDHLVDLIALALGVGGDARALVEERGVRAARRHAVLREVEGGLRNPQLSATTVALCLGITTRYVHLLLEESGQTFSEYVLEKRLERVAKSLREPRRAGQKIADIAYEAGFIDLSHFNRSFRRRFGETPTAMRTQATRPS